MEQQPETTKESLTVDIILENTAVIEQHNCKALATETFSFKTSDSGKMEKLQLTTVINNEVDAEIHGCSEHQPGTEDFTGAEEVNGNLLPKVTEKFNDADITFQKPETNICDLKSDLTRQAIDQKSNEEEMEVSVAAQIQSINFMTLQILDGTQEAAGLHVEQGGNFPQVHVTVNSEIQEGGAIEGSDENIPSEDSSSESDSDSSSSSTSPCLVLSEADDDDFMGPGKGRKPQPLKTKDEILPEELPSVEDETIILPEDVEIKQIGFVSSIIEQLVIIESLKDTPPLKDESVVFNEGRLAIGKIFEIFGPVFHPYYVLRFNSHQHIAEKDIKMQEKMYYAPSVKDFTEYIFTEKLKKERGSDASWQNDQEPPPAALDYSDDEKEKESKKKKKKTQMKQGVEQTVLNKNDEEPMQYRWQHQTPPREGRGYQGWGNNSLSQQEGFPNSAGRGCSLSRGLFNPNSNRPFRPSGFPPHYSRMMPPRPPPPHFYDQGNFMLPCPYPPPFQHPGPNRMPPFPPPPHMRMHWPNHEMGPPPPLHNVPFQPPHPPYPGCHFTPQN
ncbi:H/ACA ribonucleoprotein complex non-core subunit NAF1-like isoform X1 [Acipenser oxyrinchus oxyrinchus]|uniref:H/ACA ribonucleoprotein complex non-core subunit NAF1 n=1 Tax=Acipenser oxyrinchus oxyrinchus TaxID=40147 RepID=A0AAD8LUK7_ACIOX|nr:H/ACA ribonucleoprotein complex non-core subunit NAF1-like isoform X1 [Acipenser oxyrinchus oxyrinchus]